MERHERMPTVTGDNNSANRYNNILSGEETIHRNTVFPSSLSFHSSVPFCVGGEGGKATAINMLFHWFVTTYIHFDQAARAL